MNAPDVDAKPTKHRFAVKLLLSVLVVAALGYAGFHGLIRYLSREPPINTAALPPLSPDAVTVKAMLYLRSPVPQKINEDGIYLESRETIYVERGRLEPDPQTVVSILDSKEKKVSDMGGKSTFDVVLDEKNGLVCLANTCARLLSICPPLNDSRSCRSFHSPHKQLTGN